MNLSLKRIIGYILDVVLVTLVATLISQIKVINPYMDKYTERYENYQELFHNNSEELDNKIIDINYDLYKYRVVNSSISLVCLVLYFGLYEFLANGQTLGQKAMKIRIVQKDTKERSGVINYCIRIVILNNIIFTIMAMLLVYVLNPRSFYYAVYTIGMIQYGILLLNIIMIVVRNDHRGLHDMLSNTIVIADEASDEPEVEEIVEEPKKSSIKEKAHKKATRQLK